MYKILSKINKDIFFDLKIGTNILDIAEKYDNIMYGLKDGIYPPLGISIEPGPICCNYCPIVDHKINKDDIISYTISLQSKNGNVVRSANTRRFNKNNEIASILIEALHDACNTAIKECGVDVRLLDPMDHISEVLNAYDVKSIINLCGYNLNNSKRLLPNISPSKKMLKYCTGKMIDGETYYIDVHGTNLDKHVYAEYNDSPSIVYIPKFITEKHRLVFKNRINNHPSTIGSKIIKKLYNNHHHNAISIRKLLTLIPNSNFSHINLLYKKKLILYIPYQYIKAPVGNQKLYTCHIGKTIKISEFNNKILT